MKNRTDLFNTPILLLGYNRADKLEKLIHALRAYKAKEIFVSLDGPKKNSTDDNHKVCATRDIVTQINWDCNVYTKFLPENLGCRRAVYNGISWFFNHVESGIILEDDCIPNQLFFNYCQTMLNYYQDYEEIVHICGFNPGIPPQLFKNDIEFCNQPIVWGWATWAKAWNEMDFDCPFDENAIRSGMKNIGLNSMSQNYFLNKIWQAKKGHLNSWAYSWTEYILKYEKTSILPKNNMIRNIGIDGTGTHSQLSRIANNYNHFDDVLSFPKTIKNNVKINQKLFYKTQKPLPFLIYRHLLGKDNFKRDK